MKTEEAKIELVLPNGEVKEMNLISPLGDNDKIVNINGQWCIQKAIDLPENSVKTWFDRDIPEAMFTKEMEEI